MEWPRLIHFRAAIVREYRSKAKETWRNRSKDRCPLRASSTNKGQNGTAPALSVPLVASINHSKLVDEPQEEMVNAGTIEATSSHAQARPAAAQAPTSKDLICKGPHKHDNRDAQPRTMIFTKSRRGNHR